MNKNLEKIEVFFRKNIIKISAIYLILWFIAMFLNIHLSHKISCMKTDIDKQNLINKQYQIMHNDSTMSAIYQADKKKMESFLHAMYVEILLNKKQLKNIEDETNKIKNDYNSIYINRPQF
jgi:hypothetical protein